MALLFLDGFETYGTELGNIVSGTMQSTSGLCYSTSYAGPTVSTTVYRSAQTAPVAAQSLSMGNANVLTLTSGSALTTIYVGFAWRPTAPGKNIFGWGGNAYPIMIFSQNGNYTWQLSTTGAGLFWANDGSLVFAKQSSTVLGTSTSKFQVGPWLYIEMQYTFGSGVSGSFELRVNGTTEISLAGVDTAGGAAGFQAIGLCSNSPCYFDDLYVCDNSGFVNNTFLGPIGVYTLFPTANQTPLQLTPNGTSNFAAVKNAPYGNTFVSATGAAQADFYSMTQLPAALNVASIPGVMMKTVAKKLSTGPSSQIQIGNYYSATTTYATAQTLSVASLPINCYAALDADPTGAAWTSNAVNNMYGGIKAL